MQNFCIRYNEYKIPKNHCIKLSNLVPRVLSYPPYGARERDPGKRWSRVSQNLGDYKQTIWGRGR